MSTRAKRLLPCIAVVSVLVAGCGDDGSKKSAPAAESAPASVEVKIEDFEFGPPTTVKKGGTITFVNRDKAPHTAEADTFDSGRLDRGESKRITFDKPGTYEYFCDFHRFMTGTVEVTG